MSITSFDHFIETLENVPGELHRNFNLMTDLDKKSFEVIRRINDCVREYRETDRKDARISIYKESMELFDRARGFADDKIDLAMQTYDLVDKHIRRLESLGSNQAPLDGKNNQGHVKGQPMKGGDESSSGGQVTGFGLGVVGGEPLAVDMPLDPNEPRYCTCQQVSFGEMIACDNKDCPVEWFHFACVDLKTKPKGKWYCPECFNTNKRKKHKFKKQKHER